MPRTHDDINGHPALLAVERATTELRRGRAVLVRHPDEAVLVTAIETLTDSLFEGLARHGGRPRRLAITADRAAALGLAPGADPVAFTLAPDASLAGTRAIAGLGGVARPAPDGAPCNGAWSASLALAKHARLMPAVLGVETGSAGDDVLSVSSSAIAACSGPAALRLERVSAARVPLAGHEDCELVVFRDAGEGSDHLALVIGEADRNAPVTVRVHSACLTGDLLGSLRCDCGPQLRTAVERLAAAGGGILVYLAQEGRGIGLANKLRAYALQDRGFDTVEADLHLGFRADERGFEVAAAMLRALGVTRVRLLTNNPAKIEALRDAGIEVAGREPLDGPVNPHNARYIRAKVERAGHLATRR